jgi:predicted MFS family arabinose efflux permease
MNNKNLWVILAAVTFGRLGFAYQMQTIASLTPYFVEHLGIGYATLGTLIGLFLLPGAFVALPLGLLGRRFGEERLLVGGMLLMTLGNCIPALSPDVTTLAIGRIVAGMGAVSLSVMLGKVLADLFQGSRFVAAMGLVVAAFPLGVGLSQVVNPLLVETIGWRSAFLAGSALTGLSTVLLLVGRRPPAPGTVIGSFGWPSRAECALVLVSGLVWTVYNGGYFGFLSYVPSLLLSHGVSNAQVGWAMTAATWVSVPAILLGGAVVARFGAMPVFVLGSLGITVSVAAIALSGHWLLWSLLFGTVGALHPGIIVAAGTLSARPENRAVGMGLFYTTYYVGGTLFPVLCGGAADHFGTPAAALLTASAISVLAVPLFVLHQRLLRRGPVTRRAALA